MASATLVVASMVSILVGVNADLSESHEVTASATAAISREKRVFFMVLWVLNDLATMNRTKRHRACFYVSIDCCLPKRRLSAAKVEKFGCRRCAQDVLVPLLYALYGLLDGI